jgi:DNA-binding NarL/FixJ family response regulator
MDQLALRVSLVEDHPVLSGLLQEFIATLPRVRSCTVARSAENALLDIEGNVPDLMFIDLSLPGMNGIELIRELQPGTPTFSARSCRGIARSPTRGGPWRRARRATC